MQSPALWEEPPTQRIFFFAEISLIQRFLSA